MRTTAWTAWLTCAGLSCTPGTPEVPLSQGILGKWNLWCRTSDPGTTECPARDRDGFSKLFSGDGTMVTSAEGGTDLNGTWTLSADRLRLEFGGGGFNFSEEYVAKIVDDRLLLWSVDKEYGSIHGRAGAMFQAADVPETDGAAIERTLDGVRYQLPLPAGYRQTAKTEHRHVWSPGTAAPAGAGFEVHVSVSDRAQSNDSSGWVTEPCNDHDWGGVLSSGSTIAGIERDTSIGTSFCITDTNKVLMCSTEHVRGWLKAEENDAALKLCQAMTVHGAHRRG